MSGYRTTLIRNLTPLAVVAALTSSCDPKGKKLSGPTAAGSTAAVVYQGKDVPPGLDLRLSDGQQGKPAFDRSKLAPATKLGDAEVRQLLGRTTPLKADAADQTSFALRPSSQPPPRTGETIKSTFHRRRRPCCHRQWIAPPAKTCTCCAICPKGRFKSRRN